MKDFLTSFSNREISIIFWTFSIIIIIMLLNFTSLIGLIKAIFAKKLTSIYLLMGFYLGLIIYILDSIGLWEITLYKDFLFWLLTTAFVMLFQFSKLKTTEDFNSIILKLITINVIIDFLASNYNLSLFKEFLLVPTITFITILLVVAQQKKEENDKVIKLLNFTLSLIGLIIFSYVLYRLIKSPEELFTIKNLKSFLLSPIFTILFIPFVFFIVIYSKYEQIFMIINRYKFLSDKKKKQIKYSIFLYGNLQLKYLTNAHNITIWRKSELQNQENIKLYIKDEIKNNISRKE